MTPFSPAVTATNDKLIVLGFVQRYWLNRSVGRDKEQEKVYEEYSQKDLKVLSLLYNAKSPEKCDF